MFITDEGALNLASAILKLAAEDFVNCDFATKNSLKRFFLSEYGQVLSFGNGDLIVSNLISKHSSRGEQFSTFGS